MTGIVDAHLHVWDARQVAYPWLAETDGLSTLFELADVREAHDAIGVDRIVLVQAADDLADTEYMLEAARSESRVAGVVAWAPLREPTIVADLLDQWSDQRVVGLRHLVHRDPDRDFLRDERVHESLGLLGSRGLAFDICAESAHLLALVPDVARRHPDNRFVVDHLAKPPIRDRGWQPWADLLAAAARCPNVAVKLSGLNTAAATEWTSNDFQPYVDHALDCFGPERMMYGGDWPFALLCAASYAEVWDGLSATLDGLSNDEREHVLSATAHRTYRLGAPPSEPSGPVVEDSRS
jgi:L-fuconolactonase